ncbi:hypothetical protein F5X68DRAFT_240053 [Plectosphaerella plurivora]|uniref:BTB domain-containing protein n=1 Tax=Plectosphaerella plurivora TaxID=936078 RepID=A0A9P8VBX0_9PEZI|nr:hypothetical protein F5X68DRAFT_240053 [Plectosphaerella plurivora]
MARKTKKKKKGTDSLYHLIGADDPEVLIAHQPTKESTDELLSSLRQLHISSEYSDFGIKCSEDMYKVHKAVICPRSSFFHAVFENETQERDTAEVDLSEHDGTSVRLMVYFCYHLDYPHVKLDGTFGNQVVSGYQHTQETSNLSHHCRLYALADFCQMEGLKMLAVSNFRKEAEIHWNDPDFFEAIQFVYAATVSSDRTLRDAVVDVMMKHPTLLDRQEFKDLLKEIDLAHEMLLKIHERGLSCYWR